MRKCFRFGFVAFTAIALLGGCRKAPPPDSISRGGTKATLMLDWHPEPEFGGFYDAVQSGAFTAHGLDVTVSETSSPSPCLLVDQNQTEFATTAADQVLIARSHGTKVVAIFAVYQTSPQGVMVHQSRGFKTIGDVFTNAGDLYCQELSWVKFCQSKYQPQKVRLVTDSKSIAPFEEDGKSGKNVASQQCFITSEPILARAHGADPQTFLIADSGFNPYTAVVIAKEQLVKDHPEKVAAMAAACREGWTHYLKDPRPANTAMEKLNQYMDPATFDAGAAAQKPLIETDGGKPVTAGTMTEARWNQLSAQLVSLKVIDSPVAGRECFIAETVGK